MFIGRTDAEAPKLWPPDVKSWRIGKDPDVGKNWGQEEKWLAENEMVGWHHQLKGHEFEQTLEDNKGLGSLHFPVCAAVHGVANSQTRLSDWTMNNGEGNGNPLQCSCLEIPRDGGAWWAAVYGVAQSRTWLKQLSSSTAAAMNNTLAFLVSHLDLNWGKLLGLILVPPPLPCILEALSWQKGKKIIVLPSLFLLSSWSFSSTIWYPLVYVCCPFFRCIR